MADFGRKRLTARNILLARLNIRANLDRHMLARPPTSSSESQLADYAQLILWMDVIAFEKNNPAKLSPVPLRERVIYTYKQALGCLRYYPEMWYEYAQYLAELGEDDGALDVYKIAIEAMNEVEHCPIIYFAAADFAESRKKFAEARAIYNQLIEVDPSPLSFVMMQRFVRRNESIEAARKVFLQARKMCTTAHVYIHAALIEFFVNKEPKSAGNIFALGFKTSSADPDFLSEYVEFLLHQNDHQSIDFIFCFLLMLDMRMIIEKGLENLSSTYVLPSGETDSSASFGAVVAETTEVRKNSTFGAFLSVFQNYNNMCGTKTIELWNRYFELESLIGTFGSIKSLLHRRSQTLKLPPHFAFVGLLEQYHFMGLWPSSENHRSSITRFITRGCTFTDFSALFGGVFLGIVLPSYVHFPFYAIGASRASEQAKRLPKPIISNLTKYVPGVGTHALPEAVKLILDQVGPLPGLRLPGEIDFLLNLFSTASIPSALEMPAIFGGFQPQPLLGNRRKADEMET